MSWWAVGLGFLVIAFCVAVFVGGLLKRRRIEQFGEDEV